MFTWRISSPVVFLLLRWLSEQQILTSQNAIYPLMGFFTILAQDSPERLLSL